MNDSTEQVTSTAAQTASPAHTPGPWKVWHSIRDGSVNVVNAAGEFVCEVGNLGYAKDYEIRADARLIAAAPDLLDACERAERLFDSGPLHFSREHVSELAAIRAAIAKAKGEA